MAEVPKITPSPSPEAAAAGSRHSVYFLTGFYASAVTWGIRSINPTQPSALGLLLPVVFPICLGWWSVVDASRQRHPIPTLAQKWFILLAGVVVPGYVIWSRGWRGLGWMALHAFLWFLLATIALHVVGIIVYGDAWLRAHGL